MTAITASAAAVIAMATLRPFFGRWWPPPSPPPRWP